MNVEIGAEAALFPEKEYMSGIFVAVYSKTPTSLLANFISWYTHNEPDKLLLIRRVLCAKSM